MIEIQYVMGGLFTAFVLGYVTGKQFLVFRQITETIS
jgi:hypothetical protein